MEENLHVLLEHITNTVAIMTATLNMDFTAAESLVDELIESEDKEKIKALIFAFCGIANTQMTTLCNQNGVSPEQYLQNLALIAHKYYGEQPNA